MEPIELETVLKTAEACAIRTGGSKGVKTPERTHLLLTAHEDGSGLPERRWPSVFIVLGVSALPYVCVGIANFVNKQRVQRQIVGVQR